MTKRILIGVAALGLALAAGAAYAMGRHGHGKMMEQMISSRIDDAADFIDATPQQRQVIESAKAEILKAVQSSGADRQKQAGEVLNLLTADSVDVRQLDALVDQKAEHMKQVGHVIVDQIAKVHASLTPAQRTKLIDHIKKKHARALQHAE
jgi:Spy/CpxP family protein refolding chaperone